METHPRRVFIGDIHGRFSKLSRLLAPLLAEEQASPLELIFIGDLIDNQPGDDIDHLCVLTTVRALVEAGRARCLMGNHEFNAVGWATRHPVTGEPLRPHSENNYRQHRAFLNDVTEDSSRHHDWVDWFKTLPLFMDFGDIRAVHACWDDEALRRLRPWLDENNCLKPESWQHAFDKKHELYHLVEKVLKGPELSLPQGYRFIDKTNIERTQIRIRWWRNDATTYRHIAQVQPEMVDAIPDIPLTQPWQGFTGAPVVIGHYTLAGAPELLSDTVICVDFNAAKGDNPLVGWEYTGSAQGVACGRFIVSLGQ